MLRPSCVVVSFFIAGAHGAACPSDLTALRTDFVAQSFEASMLDGFWFEHAYIDIAQIGASCQTLNSTHSDVDGRVIMDFTVKYGQIPFTIKEAYTPTNDEARGHFIKNAQMPGGKFLSLPTVVVDVHTYGDDDTMLLYSCIHPFTEVQELVFASRSNIIDDATLENMKKVARGTGIAWNDKDLKIVDHQSCGHS